MGAERQATWEPQAYTSNIWKAKWLSSFKKRCMAFLNYSATQMNRTGENLQYENLLTDSVPLADW